MIRASFPVPLLAHPQSSSGSRTVQVQRTRIQPLRPPAARPPLNERGQRDSHLVPVHHSCFCPPSSHQSSPYMLLYTRSCPRESPVVVVVAAPGTDPSVTAAAIVPAIGRTGSLGFELAVYGSRHSELQVIGTAVTAATSSSQLYSTCATQSEKLHFLLGLISLPQPNHTPPSTPLRLPQSRTTTASETCGRKLTKTKSWDYTRRLESALGPCIDTLGTRDDKNRDR